MAEAALKAPYRFCTAYFPKILTRRSHAGRVDYVERPFIPRYGFADGDWRTVRSCPGVSCVVAQGREVIAAVAEIQAREYGAVNKDGEPVRYIRLDEELVAAAGLRAGDAVEVSTLAARGIFRRMRDTYRAVVMLQMFGQAREVDVPRWALEAV